MVSVWVEKCRDGQVRKSDGERSDDDMRLRRDKD